MYMGEYTVCTDVFKNQCQACLSATERKRITSLLRVFFSLFFCSGALWRPLTVKVHEYTGVYEKSAILNKELMPESMRTYEAKEAVHPTMVSAVAA